MLMGVVFQHLCEEICMEKCMYVYIHLVHEITNVSKKISAAVVLGQGHIP